MASPSPPTCESKSSSTVSDYEISSSDLERKKKTTPLVKTSPQREDQNPAAEDTNEKKVYSCKFCGQKFSAWQALGGHQNKHKPERFEAKYRKTFGPNYIKCWELLLADRYQEMIKCSSSSNSSNIARWPSTDWKIQQLINSVPRKQAPSTRDDDGSAIKLFGNYIPRPSTHYSNPIHAAAPSSFMEQERIRPTPAELTTIMMTKRMRVGNYNPNTNLQLDHPMINGGIRNRNSQLQQLDLTLKL